MTTLNPVTKENISFKIPALYKQLIGGLRNIKNKYFRNEKNTWDAQYKNDYSDKMDCADQQPRNRAIAGIALENYKHGMKILDIGCGTGTLYNYFSGLDINYTGIDLSYFAVEKAKENFTETNAKFFPEDFEEFDTKEKFDVIIFNEVLYYFPFEKILPAIKKAISLVSSPQSVLIISMSPHIKSANVWKILKPFISPSADMEIKSRFSGSRWIIKTYSGFGEK
jgi:2-polyprenyl-3-methyl-5-hydroxy-6-metoxy-1,4-benzoquinol methylase